MSIPSDRQSSPSGPSTRRPQRRRFIALLPWAGVAGLGALSACSDKKVEPPPAPDTTPAPAAAPAPAPAPTSAGADAGASTPVAAANLPMVDPADPAAAALGYVADTSQIDPAKSPKHVAGQACANCALFAGKPGDLSGPCPLYAGKQVSAKAWCTAYSKKAG